MKNKKIKQLINSERAEKKGKNDRKGRKKWMVVVLILVLAIGGGSVTAVVILRKNGNATAFSMPGNMAGLTLTEDMVAASGVTNVGITEETFDVENLTTDLEIEEVYAVSGEEVTAGDKILKLTEDSVAEARKELERTLRDAELSYRTGKIEYEQNLITAEYTKDSAILTGQQAKEVYDETVASLQSAVTKAEEELQEAEDDIAEYESYVNDGSYKSYFKVDEYQAIYDENLKALTDKMDEWGVSWSQVTGGGGSVQIGGGAGSNMQSRGTSNASILASLYSVLEQNLKDLEEAQEKYDDAVTTEAKENKEIQQAQAKLTYETALSTADRAESDYNTTVEKAESDLAALKSTYEDAKENLELFESSVGDGYFYASEDGTILRTVVRADQNLTSDAVVFVYSNPRELTVTVSVDQADIAKLTVSDSAYVQSSANGGFTGEITAIDPVSSSDSRTSVTYSVTVKIMTEDEENENSSSLSANESVTVIFGMTEEEIARMQEQMQQRMQGGPGDVSGGDAMSEGGTVPEGNSGDRERPQGRPGDESSESDNTTDGNVGDDVRGEEQQGGQTQS